MKANISLLLLLTILLAGCRAAIPPAPSQPLPTLVSAAPTATLRPITPTPSATRVPPSDTAIYYTVQYGDTLTAIAIRYGTTVATLLRLNGLTNPDQLKAGRRIQVALAAQKIGPGNVLLPDSELLYGPAYATFDLVAATATYTGLLKTYTEEVEGEQLTGVEIVQRIAEQYSVGPRVLLTLLELRGGWLTNPDPVSDQRRYPLGYTAQPYWEGLYTQLLLAANALNAGFYGWRADTLWLIQTEDGTALQFATTLNAATAGVQRALSAGAPNEAAWRADLTRFAAIYQRLFGDPFRYTHEPLLPADLQAPPLTLPWAAGETWYFTGGPHPGWGSGSAWAALDFVTAERNLGCRASKQWVTAAATGKIIRSRTGEVWQDLDNDGFLGSGWVILYMHIATDGRVPVGVTLKPGGRIGHPSCEGGVGNASHLHIARRYNGLWIAADDSQWPMQLSGWLPTSTGDAYDGALTKGSEIRTAEEDWLAQNAIRHPPAD